MEKRTPFRPDHLELAKEYENRKDLILGGAFNPPTGAALVFHVKDESMVEEFAKKDPYVVNKLVTEYRIKPWTVVVGSLAKSMK